MGRDGTLRSRREWQRPPAWRLFSWVGLFLSLLVAACSNNPAPTVMPTSTGSASPTMITAYHGHTSTVYAVAWSPDGTRIASGGNDTQVHLWQAPSACRK